MSFQLLTLVTCVVGMALVGLVYNATAVHFMVAALVGVIAVSYLVSRLSARALEWRRDAADRVFEHEPITVSAELTNLGRLPRFLLTVTDILPRFLTASHPPEFVLPALWPGEKVRLAYQVQATKRGVYSLGPLKVSVSDPFGVFRRSAPFDATVEAVVYPRPIQLTSLEISDTMSDPAQAGGERSQASESGLEFYGVRDYQPGDELRRIHWPATAHHNRLTVIEFERGASRSVTVVLDSLAGTEYGVGADTSFETAVRVAASLIHWALQSHGYASLVVESADGTRFVEVDRLDREYEALEQLARVQPTGTMPVSQLLGWAAHQVPQGGSVCIVSAGPDKDLPGAIALLMDQRVRVSAALVDPFSFDSRAPTLRTDALEAASTVMTVIRRGDDLREALSGAFILGR